MISMSRLERLHIKERDKKNPTDWYAHPSRWNSRNINAATIWDQLICLVDTKNYDLRFSCIAMAIFTSPLKNQIMKKKHLQEKIHPCYQIVAHLRVFDFGIQYLLYRIP